MCNSKSLPLIALIFLICLVIFGCEDIGDNKINLVDFEIELPEQQAITNNGIPVVAPDIGFGKIYFNWQANYKTKPYTYHVYLSKDKVLDESDHLLASSGCNTVGVPCYPIKQRNCKITNNRWFECLSNRTKVLDLNKFGHFNISGFSAFMILKVCPYGFIDHADCNWLAKPIRFEQTCSEYLLYECADSQPLVISDFQVKTQYVDDNGNPYLLYKISAEQKFWLNWLSSWKSKQSTYKIEITYKAFGVETSELLVEGGCNDRVNCYPGIGLLCKYSLNETTGKIFCISGNRTVVLNQLASAHPMDTVEISFRLTIEDNESQQPQIFNVPLKIEGEP